MSSSLLWRWRSFPFFILICCFFSCLFFLLFFLFFFILIILGLFPFVSVVLAKCICVGNRGPRLLHASGASLTQGHPALPHHLLPERCRDHPSSIKQTKKRLHGPFQIKRLWSLTHPCNYFSQSNMRTNDSSLTTHAVETAALPLSVFVLQDLGM